jgi:hypothetical protein
VSFISFVLLPKHEEGDPDDVDECEDWSSGFLGDCIYVSNSPIEQALSEA